MSISDLNQLITTAILRLYLNEYLSPKSTDHYCYIKTLPKWVSLT